MAERGYLEGKSMVTVFNLLRSNDLIWPYIINNYMMGKAPSRSTCCTGIPTPHGCRQQARPFYLRNCYLDNKLTKGGLTIGNTPINLKSIKIPVYNLATREDHIAPAKSVLLGSKYFGGPVRYVLSGSGHIAGVVNPPDKHKYQYWTGPKPRSANLEGWLAKATEHPGLLVARLARLAQGAGRDRSARARPRRRCAQTDRGCAGELREGAGVSA